MSLITFSQYIITIIYTFPKIGSSTELHVSAAQWTNPDPKSAVIMPQNAAIAMGLKFSNRNLTRINIELTTMSVMQIPTQIHSCVLLPKTNMNKYYINTAPHQKREKSISRYALIRNHRIAREK